MEPQELDEGALQVAFSTLFGLLLSALVGIFLALLVLPHWLPALGESMRGEAPKAYWYLSRASGLVAYVMLWLSVVLGLMITGRIARLWPGGPAAFELHQHTAWLALTLSGAHALVLLGDRYVSFTLERILIPFAATDYRPFWVGLGQLGFYLLAVVTLTFYVRRQIGHTWWRRLHYLSFVVFFVVTLHGIMSGTDTERAGVRMLYQIATGTVSVMMVYRGVVVPILQFLRPGRQSAGGSPARPPQKAPASKVPAS